MQAIMSLMQFGEYISWKLPKKTHLLLTSNEDDGFSSVSSLDSAQMSRLITLKLDFDADQFGAWMDANHLNSQAINFMLLNKEIFDNNPIINARTYTMFANAIGGISQYTPENLALISNIAKGCFGDDTNIGDLFATFVDNRLDKLISASTMLGTDWNEVSTKILENVYRDGEYRADIASVLTIRLINHIVNDVFVVGADKKVSDKVCNRILDIITWDETHGNQKLLTNDLMFTLIKKLNAKFPARCSKLLTNPKVFKLITA